MVVCGEGGEILECFYNFRKSWDDCKHRVIEMYFNKYMGKIVTMRRLQRIRKRLV